MFSTNDSASVSFEAGYESVRLTHFDSPSLCDAVYSKYFVQFNLGVWECVL